MIIKREEGDKTLRIDITIKGEKKAIIVENKINNAIDGIRQIPKYHNYLEKNGYIVESIVYLSLNGEKSPNKSSWKTEDVNKVAKKIVNIGAYNETSNDIYTLLKNCEHITNDFNYLALIRQYNQLIKYLGRKVMNKPIMKNFFETVIKDNNFETLMSIREMLNDLPKYRAIKIKGSFEQNPSPFKEVAIYKDYTAYFDSMNINQSNFALDIYCTEEQYSIQFFDRNAAVDNNQTTIELLRAYNFNFIELEKDRRVYKYFKFPEQEKEVYDFIEKFRLTLNKDYRKDEASHQQKHSRT